MQLNYVWTLIKESRRINSFFSSRLRRFPACLVLLGLPLPPVRHVAAVEAVEFFRNAVVTSWTHTLVFFFGFHCLVPLVQKFYVINEVIISSSATLAIPRALAANSSYTTQAYAINRPPRKAWNSLLYVATETLQSVNATTGLTLTRQEANFVFRGGLGFDSAAYLGNCDSGRDENVRVSSGITRL
jgi:hypothetical protein